MITHARDGAIGVGLDLDIDGCHLPLISSPNMRGR
jgi:hypothetical protein